MGVPLVQIPYCVFGFIWIFLQQMNGFIVLLFARLILPRATYLQVAENIQKWYLSQFVYLWEKYDNLHVRITGDEVPDRECALIVPNHINHDWAPLYSFAIRKNMIGGVRCVIKKVIQFVFPWGTAMWFMNWPFLKRNWKNDQKYLNNKMNQYKKDGVPLHVWCFPEGTRFTSQKYDDSKKFAKKNGLVTHEHCLIPRTKGFVTLTQGLNGVITHIYDVTIAYSGWKLKGKYKGPGIIGIFFPTPYDRPHTMHIHVKRFSVKELPNDAEGLAKWCKESFARKDKLLKIFHEKGEFPGEDRSRALEKSEWFSGFIIYSSFNVILFLFSFAVILWYRYGFEALINGK